MIISLRSIGQAFQIGAVTVTVVRINAGQVALQIDGAESVRFGAEYKPLQPEDEDAAEIPWPAAKERAA